MGIRVPLLFFYCYCVCRVAYDLTDKGMFTYLYKCRGMLQYYVQNVASQPAFDEWSKSPALDSAI